MRVLAQRVSRDTQLLKGETMTDYILTPLSTLADLDYAMQNGTVTPLSEGYCRVRLNEGVEPTAGMIIDDGTIAPVELGTFV